MSSRVFILGAGSSAAFETVKGRCPTISEFFIRASQIGLIKRYRELHMSEPLFRFINKEFGIHKPDLYLTAVNIEDVITRLEEKIERYYEYDQYTIKGQMRRTKKSVSLSGTRLQVTTFIGHVLLELTNNVSSPLHVQLARKLTTDDTVISFNYDLLMDSALEHSGIFSISDYCIPFKQVIEKGLYSDFVPLPKGIAFLKLHGSLNWLYGISPYKVVNNLPVPNGEDIFLLKDLNHVIEPGPMDIAGKYEYTENRNNRLIYYDLHSLIVAPRRDKPYASFPKHLIKLWEYASDAVEKADEIILIGYSIPDSDIKSQELFRITKPCQFTIVDINPAPIKERLERLTGTKAVIVYPSFKDYISAIT